MIIKTNVTQDVFGTNLVSQMHVISCACFFLYNGLCTSILWCTTRKTSSNSYFPVYDGMVRIVLIEISICMSDICSCNYLNNDILISWNYSNNYFWNFLSYAIGYHIAILMKYILVQYEATIFIILHICNSSY